jgi:translation elongation factor EF-Tu-like GTPase
VTTNTALTQVSLIPDVLNSGDGNDIVNMMDSSQSIIVMGGGNDLLIREGGDTVVCGDHCNGIASPTSN